LVGILKTKAGGSHNEGINVKETAAPSDEDDHLTPKGATVIILLAGILRALVNANAVHAGEQQLGKTGALQALAVGLSLSSAICKKTGCKLIFAKEQRGQEIL
jgi:hypothetical protein